MTGSNLLPAGLGRSLLLAMALAAASAVQAVPITYSFAGIASGSATDAGGATMAFTDRSVEFTVSTDTTNIALGGGGFGDWIGTVDPVILGLAIEGVGSGQLSQLPGYLIYAPAGHKVTYFTPFTNDLLRTPALLGPGIDSYALVSTIGPLTPDGQVDTNFGGGLPWTLGSFALTSVKQVTFQSTLAPVPEPQAWTLMLAGLLGVGAVVRRRR